ncbi:MAG: outer membrane beta-barrel protein [Gammaproteobacteria bacterium]|nr:outer membrane beta-barrel protein [Gammaproteobacteria bacterium]MDE0251570.1 outer membrane beta-barrel protein [Gammaproteobacteria bacterium]MDE0403420.1 outer membrane beta-barrel protein [Gammaproteobacteria bacterium]
MTLTKYSTPLPSPIMTITTIMLAVFITVGVYGKETESTWYAIGGGSIYAPDIGEEIGEGLGIRAGAGVQLNEVFGVELVRDYIPSLVSFVSSVLLNAIGIDNEVTSSGYVYSSLLGTAKKKMGEDVHLVSKLGIGYYYVEAEFRYPHIDILDEISFEGWTPVASIGVQFPVGQLKNLSAEISATHYFDEEVKTTGYGLSLMYQF